MSAKKASANGKNLVIVESPAKAKTINKYLGSGFTVMASMGHIRDLPNKNMGVDVENSFEPTYEIIPTRKKTLATLKLAAKEAPYVYLATDLDREGEAIAWHLQQALKIDDSRTRRVVFNQITKDAIRTAFANASTIDIEKVYAQQARRILDRIVGYEISPLLWKKVARGLSAGRVQSVAVKLIVEREREIQAFVPQEYWKFPGIFSTQAVDGLEEKYQKWVKSFGEKEPTQSERSQWMADHHSLQAFLATIGGVNFQAHTKEEADKAARALAKASFKITEVKTKRSKSMPSAPFITSTMQQQAANRLGFSTKRTMRLAQDLYEGIEISGLGSIGLITYMRTDSTHIAPEALNAAREYIGKTFGEAYLPDKARIYASSNKSAQEAHEAIRPTDVTLAPDDLKNDLSVDQLKLYRLIWSRFLGSQMANGEWDVTSVSITGTSTQGPAVFKASGRKLVFDGFMKVTGLTLTSGEQLLPEVQEGQAVYPVELQPTQHFTSPPPRYTEASLVKTLEADGIGRPSTYATIISTIQDRGYVEQIDRKFHATDMGIVVTDKLNDHFPQVMDTAFTSHVEEQLDKIEEQHLNWVKVLQEFYGPFKDTLARAHEEMAHAKAETQPSDYQCPECSKPMVYRFGKNGRFLSCSDYPTCKFAAPCDREGKLMQPEATEHKCPKCGKDMILRKGRFGTFLGCSDYPACKTTQQIDKEGNILPPKEPPQPSGLKCYKCGGDLVIRQSKRGPFLGCGKFPRCRTIISMKQYDMLKELQEQGKWPPKTYEEADEILGRKKKPAGKGKKAAAEEEAE